MDTKLLLIKCITLLYLESLIPNSATNSIELVNEVLGLVKLPDSYISGDFGKDPLIAIRETARSMASNPANTTYDKSDLLQRIRLNAGTDDRLYEAFVEGVHVEVLEEASLTNLCHMHRRALRDFAEQTKLKDLLKNVYTQTHYQAAAVDFPHLIADLQEKLGKFNFGADKNEKHPSEVTDINFEDPEAVKTVFLRGQETLDIRGVLRFGTQGMNRSYGIGGGRRGEFHLTGALAHNYKSGTELDKFRSVALYNKPLMFDPTKKPLLLRISFENPAEHDLMNLYRSLVEMETGLKVEIETTDPAAAAVYVIERMTASGYHIRMKHFDPTNFTYRDLFDLIESYEAQGFEIHFLSMDYLNMISKRGCAQGPAGVDIRDLFRRVRNFCSKKGIMVSTPHQLSPDAKRLFRQGMDNFVQEVGGKGYYDGCTTIDQEVDYEMVQHIVRIGNEAYLTHYMSKHRRPGPIVRMEDRFWVYKFEEIGTIVDDVNGLDMSRKSVGGSTMAEGGAGPWWQNM